jgi:ABC-2 type transport system permease protein
MRRRLETFKRVALHELRVLSAERSLWLVSFLLVTLLGYALWSGLEQSRVRDVASAATRAQEAAQHDNVLARWRRVMAGEEAPDPWANPTDPSLVGGGLVARYALLPTAPLAPLAVGQSDMFPDSYRVTSESRVDFMYDSEIENPWNLLTGRFDVAFVLTYLLPLFIFVWSYNFLASERDQGTLRMLLAQPVGLRTVVMGKIAVRGTLLLFWAVATPLVGLLLLRPEARDRSAAALLACWAGLIAAYTLFWFAYAVLVDSFAKSSALNALILVSSWVILVLVIPVALNLGASRLSPAPSRAELATQTRLLTIENLNQLKDQFGTDYRHVYDPELLLPKDGRFEVPERLRAFFVAGQRLDQQIEAALSEFDARLAGQQRLVDRLAVLSPAILVHEGMASIAGNGAQRFLRFQDQVTAFHKAWKQFFEPRILEGVAITEADFARLPSWSWQEQDAAVVRSEALSRLLQMVGLGTLLGLAAAAKLRRYPIV